MDYSEYTRASNGDGEAVRMIVTTDRGIGNMDLITDSVLNWPDKFIATSGDLDVETGLIDPASICIFYAHLSGSIVVIDEFAPGYSDVGHTTGMSVVLKPTTAWADAIAEGGGGSTVTIGETPPPDPGQGDLWGDTLGDNANSLVTAVAELLMPVGHVLITNSSTNPATTYGFGTWARIQGRFIVGVDDSDADFDLNDTGGAKTHDHNLETSAAWAYIGLNSSFDRFNKSVSISAYTPSYEHTGGSNDITGSRTNATQLGGDTDPADGLPPYIAKYIWERTA